MTSTSTLAQLANNALISMLAQLANNALKIQWFPSGSGCYELYPPWLRNKQWGTMDLWMGKYFSPQGWNRPLLPPKLDGNGEKPPLMGFSIGGLAQRVQSEVVG